MDSDEPLIPRKKAIPVVAQRALEVTTPAPVNEPQPPAAPQPYVIFVNTPPPVSYVPASQAPAAPFQHVAQPVPVQHFHTTHTATTTNNYYSRSRQRRTAYSTLGIAALSLGVIACVICWVPVLGLAAVPIGLIGAVLAIFGIVISSVFRRSSAALPAGGLFVCILAAAISIGSTGTAVYWRHRLAELIPANLRTVTPQTANPPLPNSRATNATQLPAIIRSSPKPALTPTPVDPAVLNASQQLRDAELAVADRVKATAEYQHAVQEAADAHSAVSELRQQSPRSSALADASRRMIDADNALSDIVARAQFADPAVQLARQNLAALHQPASH